MSASTPTLRPRRLPLLGLLLSLLLYVGGGLFAAGHFHEDEADVAGHDCLTCLLAAATVAAVAATLLPTGVVSTSLRLRIPQRLSRSRPLADLRARAPPALLI